MQIRLTLMKRGRKRLKSCCQTDSDDPRVVMFTSCQEEEGRRETRGLRARREAGCMAGHEKTS